MARKERTGRRIRAARKSERTCLRNLVMRKGGRNGTGV